MTALVIEASRTWRNVHTAMLRSLGFVDVAEATGGWDALSRAAAIRPTLILVSREILLSREAAGGDPTGLVAGLRRSSGSAVVLVVVGATDNEPDGVSLVQGADACLARPYTRDDLRRRIEEATDAAA